MHIRVDGPARLYAGDLDCHWTGTFESLHMKELGITENGVQVSVNQLTHRVNSDDMGGAEGNPAEILIMGSTATIRGVIVKYPSDRTRLGQIFSGIGGIGEGWTWLPGSPLFAGGGGFSFLIWGYTTYFYFPRCEMVTQPREFNISTTERKTSFAIQALPIHDSWGSALYETGPAYYLEPPLQCENGIGGEYYGHGGSVSAYESVTNNNQTSYNAVTKENYSTFGVTEGYSNYSNPTNLHGSGVRQGGSFAARSATSLNALTNG